MAKRVLHTIFHVSDLHVGEIDADGVTGPPDAAIKRWWGLHKECYGFLGHTFQAMRQLEEFFADATEGIPATVVVTGDLTTCGADAEFEIATSFLTNVAVFPPRREVGLRVTDLMERSVPGNHDHWPGKRCIIGPRNERLFSVFPDRPFSPQFVHLSETHRLVVFGINTDEDVHGFGPSRLLGRARCLSQLAALEKQLEHCEAQPGDIRILLLHHSRMHQKSRLGMTAATLDKLNRVIEKWQISVLLSGHLHIPAVRVQRIAGPSVSWDLIEARCGTSLQRDTVPETWIQQGFTAATLEPNNVLVHQIVETEGALEWHTASYSRTDRGFREHSLAGNKPVVL
jgi:3',5'-cyclic AMP phosphodiesterase CpdA